jgi:ubiquinone/menaquinone biosynthesis C-methylase UbiE
MYLDLKKLVVEEFSGENAQSLYIQKANEGLWLSESYAIKKYFTKLNSSVLDLGCGTGRTTIPLYEQGFQVTGIDLVPKMIENARKIAQGKHLDINYQVGDATSLHLPDESFDYALFSNNGWTQIPDQKNRLAALQETYRILKPNGVFIFTAHPRIWKGKFFFFWLKQWFRFYILKKIGLPIPEQDFGDRFFARESSAHNKIYKTKQYIHIPSIKDVRKEIEKTKFKILEINPQLQISNKEFKPYPSVFYICQK